MLSTRHQFTDTFLVKRVPYLTLCRLTNLAYMVHVMLGLYQDGTATIGGQNT